MTPETTPFDPRREKAPIGVPDDPFPGEFRLMGKLGGGGFGVVYKAQDLSPLGRFVALKFLAPHASLDCALAALRNDARHLAAVRHPNVVAVHAWKTTAAGLPCLVMDFVSGGSLHSVLGRDGPLPWSRAARYVADVASGLGLLHAKAIVHRDIKPDNMLLDGDRDEAILTDLGIAARLDDTAPSAGTLPYMSPEAFDGHVSPAGDVYALAASLFTLLAGSPPFRGHDPVALIAACRDGLPSPDPRLPLVPQPIEHLIRDGLAADLSRRPPLADFSSRLRGTLNALLADSLAVAGPGVRLTVSRREATGLVPAATTDLPPNTLRDMRLAPEPPRRVTLFTGDRVRVEVEAARAGYVTVLNVGPTGNLNLLLALAPIRPRVPMLVGEVELTPPAGNERLFALWTESPNGIRLEHLRGLVEQAGTPTAGAYRATRDMARVRETLAGLPEAGRASAVIELEHVHPGGPTT